MHKDTNVLFPLLFSCDLDVSMFNCDFHYSISRLFPIALRGKENTVANACDLSPLHSGTQVHGITHEVQLVEYVFFAELMIANVAVCFLALFRFHVLSKLLSFMAPIDHTSMNDDAR